MRGPLPFRSLAGFRATRRGREKGLEGCWNPKLLLLCTSWCLLEQERMFMFVEQPRLPSYFWALHRPHFSELRLAEVKRLAQVTKSWNGRAGTQSRSGMTPKPVLFS